MKLLFYPSDIYTFNAALAKEIGVAESLILPRLYAEIEKHGTLKDGHQMIARTSAQLKDMFPWSKLPTTKSVLSKMQDAGLIYISTNTLFNDPNTFWYALNWSTIRTLKSVAVMTEDEIEEARLEPPPQVRLTEKKTPEESHLYKVLWSAMMEVCGWGNALALTIGDRREAGAVINKLISEYSTVETDDLRDMLLGVEWYRINILKQSRPFRPSGVARVWDPYEKYCNEFLNGNPPKREN